MFQAVESKIAYYKALTGLGNGKSQGLDTEARKEVGLYLKVLKVLKNLKVEERYIYTCAFKKHSRCEAEKGQQVEKPISSLSQ